MKIKSCFLLFLTLVISLLALISCSANNNPTYTETDIESAFEAEDNSSGFDSISNAEIADGEIAHGDIIFDRLNTPKILQSKLVLNGKIYTDIIRSHDIAIGLLPGIGVSESALSVYDEQYFAEFDLLVIVFKTDTICEQTLASLEIENNVLTASFNEKVPEDGSLIHYI